MNLDERLTKIITDLEGHGGLVDPAYKKQILAMLLKMRRFYRECPPEKRALVDRWAPFDLGELEEAVQELKDLKARFPEVSADAEKRQGQG